MCKQTFSKFNILYKSGVTNVARCSTVIEKAQNEEELDKLYKSLELELKGNDSAVLRSFAKFSTTAAAHLGIDSNRYDQINQLSKLVPP